MTEIALVGASCEASGHPVECTEPAPGSVESSGSHGITVTADGTTRELATIASADMVFSEHAHDYDETNGCHQLSSHTIDPDAGETSITINGSPVYRVENAVATDPVSSGNVDIVSNAVSTNIELL